MNFQTYVGKTFIVEDNEARLRQEQDLSKPVLYKAGDALPPDKKIGDPIVIPRFTEISVLEARIDPANTVFILAAPLQATNGAAPLGWTKATNLAGGMINEIVGLAPAAWDLLPERDDCCTVTNAAASLRGGAPKFLANGTTIPPDSYVLITARSPDGKFVKVCRGTLSTAGESIAGDELGWTAAAHLTGGWSKAFGEKSWADAKGPNSAWERGRCVGPKVLVNIIGTGGALKQIPLDSLPAYFKLKDAAAKDNVDISITSGFRTFGKQQELFDIFRRGGNLAAVPGRSNHQHGQAFDLNTAGFDGTRVYDWLKQKGPRHGFIRTVNKEHWHWEHRPDDAARLMQQGQFKLASVAK